MSIKDKTVERGVLISKIAVIVFAMVCGRYFIEYMRLPKAGIVWACAFIIMYYLFSGWRLEKQQIPYMIFSGILSIAVILGYHMELHGSMYTGLMTENYMTSLTVNDVIAFLLLTITITALLEKIITRFTRKVESIEIKCTYGISNKKAWLGAALIIFILWIPYLVIYYPGFIFGDSLGSIAQALGVAKLYNHHPIFYTLFLKMCLSLGIFIKDITFGCAVYTIVQMIYIALCLGYQICWIRNKGIGIKICIILTVFFGCIPFFAQNSIAMWKDPIFSSTLAVWSLVLADFALSKGKIISDNRFFLVKSNLLLVVLCFSRNNGFYIGLFCELVIILIWILNRRKKIITGLKKLMVSTGCILLIISIVIGPVYTKLDLNGEPVESLGIFLNQMASVVAYDGDMTEEDREYMNGLLPLENYKDTYRPCVVDLLKWDQNFSQKYLNEHLNGFMKTYISMFIRNPYTYIEAWALNTYGYWALNRWELNTDANNIYKGNLGDIENGENYGIVPHSLLEIQKVDCYTNMVCIFNSIINYKKAKMGTGIGNCTDIGACHNTFCCNTICLLAEIWIGTVLLSSILYIYSCIFTKREKGMKVHRKVRLYEKKLILLIFSLFVLLICSESYFYIMSKKYPEIKISQEQFYGKQNENLKDFKVEDGKIISLSGDPWVTW